MTEREWILAACAQIPELEARRLASESIPVGTLSGERLPDKDTPIVHMDKDTLLYPCIIFYIVNLILVIYYYCVW